MKKKIEILRKEYGWESVIEIEEDVWYAMSECEDIPIGEWPGTMRVIVEYEYKKEK